MRFRCRIEKEKNFKKEGPRYMKKRILSLAISAALVLTMLPAGALAAGDKGTPPVYNKATGCYEISTPDQLLYLSGSWKDGAPRDGHYVLTADIDMSGVKGFKAHRIQER